MLQLKIELRKPMILTPHNIFLLVDSFLSDFQSSMIEECPEEIFIEEANFIFPSISRSETIFETAQVDLRLIVIVWTMMIEF